MSLTVLSLRNQALGIVAESAAVAVAAAAVTADVAVAAVAAAAAVVAAVAVAVVAAAVVAAAVGRSEILLGLGAPELASLVGQAGRKVVSMDRIFLLGRGRVGNFVAVVVGKWRLAGVSADTKHRRG